MFKGRPRLERTPSVRLQRGQGWLLQVLGPSEKLTEERHSVHFSPHMWFCKLCVAGCWSVCAIVDQKESERNGQLWWGLLWTLLLPYYSLGCCTWALWLVINTYSPLLAANFAKAWPAQTKVARAVEKGGWPVAKRQLSFVALNLMRTFA